MLDLGHEVQYSKTHEDLLYGSAVFAGVYAGANVLSRLGAPQKLPGMLALGAHGTTLGSNFLLGFAGNAFNLTNKTAHKMFGNYGWAKQMMTNEGMNLGAFNFRTQSVNAFNAAGGYGSSVLPGVNVSLKGQMAKHLDSTVDFTQGIASKALEEKKLAAELYSKFQNTDDVGTAAYEAFNNFKVQDDIAKGLSGATDLTRQNVIDDGVKAINSAKAKKAGNIKKARRALKKEKALGESIKKELFQEGQSLDDLINLTKQSYVQDDIIAASQSTVDNLMLSTKEVAKQYGDEAAAKIVANLSDDALLKFGGKELAGKAIASEADRVLLQTAAKTEIGRQVARQARNAAFAKTLAGRGLAGVGAVAGGVGKFLFSAPVQTVLMAEMALNLAASARTNNQVRNIKEYQGAKQAYFNNPATQSAIQKGGAIYQNNNNDLNFLLSSPNVATQVANRR